jgi:hypothetical protein
MIGLDEFVAGRSHDTGSGFSVFAAPSSVLYIF